MLSYTPRFSTKIPYSFPCSPHMPHALPNSSYVIQSHWHFLKSTHHAESNYALFSITSAILAGRIFRNTLFLKAPSLCSFFNATVHHSHKTKNKKKKSGYSCLRWLGDRNSFTGNGNTASLHQYCLQRDSGAYIASLPFTSKYKTTGRWR